VSRSGFSLRGSRKRKVLAGRVPLLTAFGARAAVTLDRLKEINSYKGTFFLFIKEPFVTPCVELASLIYRYRRFNRETGGVTG
jgi:hypothetical protein